MQFRTQTLEMWYDGKDFLLRPVLPFSSGDQKGVSLGCEVPAGPHRPEGCWGVQFRASSSFLRLPSLTPWLESSGTVWPLFLASHLFLTCPPPRLTSKGWGRLWAKWVTQAHLPSHSPTICSLHSLLPQDRAHSRCRRQGGGISADGGGDPAESIQCGRICRTP